MPTQIVSDAPLREVAILEDDPQVRSFLMRIVDSVGLPVRAFDSHDAFASDFDPHATGCLVMDLHLPGQNGLAILDDLNPGRLGIPVIVITGWGDVSTATRAFKAGVVEFLEKPIQPTVFLDAIQQAIQLQREILHAHAKWSRLHNLMSALDRKDQEVLTGIEQGFSNKAIAASLGITQRAVEMRRAKLLEKLKVRTVAELLKLVLQHRYCRPANYAAVWPMYDRMPAHSTPLRPPHISVAPQPSPFEHTNRSGEADSR